MTMKSFGQIVPLQGFMLMLAGYGNSQEAGTRDLYRPAVEEELITNIKKGHELVAGLVDNDFGFSLSEWHKYLSTHENYSKQYKFSRSWERVEKAILTEIKNPNRADLERHAAQSNNKP
ncbi:hypothetical protein [Parasulfitobacter algicola]|uniref:Uncharacterized protein n=1 Tax=Parasulfitobacter algicola TaxID=2614809 RepID=A0ABX2IUT4_9RHOB|nr:hypothetical protein [Sulfitobacter algicola]NSX56669.1 hypothetical protein [Sulfitobacter algicola]